MIMMRVALVYDRINKFGGAERVLRALHEVWPDAPLYTAVYNAKKAIWSQVFSINSSFMQFVPFSSSLHEIFPVVTPLVFESFSFDNYDLVISITSSDAKGIITKPSSCHICYCLTPTRYLWSAYQDYLHEPGFGSINPLVSGLFKFFSRSLRQWDYIASYRPDAYLAISKTAATRIQKYYRKEAKVIYPPVDIDTFKLRPSKSERDYFLIVSRLVPYKKIDYVISAFNDLGWRLVIIGNGIDEKRLKNSANYNIEFVNGDLTDKKLCWYYENCRALIFPGEEDFGITSVEAQACGKPVVALNKGGATESIISGITGELYDVPDAKHLISALKVLVKKYYSPKLCRQNALKFNRESFKKQFREAVEVIWSKWKGSL